MKPVSTLVARLLRLPSPPQVPSGSEGSVRRFGPAAGYYRLHLLRWAGTQISSAVGLFLAFGWPLIPFLVTLYEGLHIGPFTLAGLLQTRWFQFLEVLGLGTYLVQLPVSFVMVGLDYRSRWYLLTDRSLRIREGLVTVHERTMSFANIQNVTIRRGPVQRVFGIADLQVRSAGGGDRGDDDDTGQSKLHLAYFRGVDNAGEIRDLVLDHLKRLRSAGTGDPDDGGHAADADAAVEGAADRLDRAIVALRNEAVALRRLVAASQ